MNNRINFKIFSIFLILILLSCSKKGKNEVISTEEIPVKTIIEGAKSIKDYKNPKGETLYLTEDIIPGEYPDIIKAYKEPVDDEIGFWFKYQNPIFA